MGLCSWAQQSGPWLEEEGFTQNELCPQLGLHKEVRAGGGTLWLKYSVIAQGCQRETRLGPASLQLSYTSASFLGQDLEPVAHLKGKSSDFYVSTSLSG